MRQLLASMAGSMAMAMLAHANGFELGTLKLANYQGVPCAFVAKLTHAP